MVITAAGSFITSIDSIKKLVINSYNNQDIKEDKITTSKRIIKSRDISINNTILKVFERCEKINDCNVNDPSISSLLIYKDDAIPLLINFIAESINISKNMDDPLFLPEFRKKITGNCGFVCLIRSLIKICKNDASKEYIAYFNEILNHKLNTTSSIKEAILLSYILWNFDDKDVIELERSLLFDKEEKVPAILKKVILRSYLYRNKKYFLLSKINRPVTKRPI